MILFTEVNMLMSFKELGTVWPVLLGGQASWTVGLVVTIISICSIIAADTGALFGGRVWPLHHRTINWSFCLQLR